MAEDQDKTNKAILDQLVYIDNFIGDDNDLNFDLSAFADDLFVFADEEKPPNNKIDEIINQDKGLHNLPRFPVPPGAKNSLEQAGLNQSQIDLLSALIAQYQLVQKPALISQQEVSNLQSIQQSNLDHPPLSRHVSISGSGSSSGDQVSPQKFEFKDSNFTFENPALSPLGLFQEDFPQSDSSAPGISPAESSKSIDNDIDKRRRNTAASARFRIKKKMKEKQMEDKINSLQDMIRNFETKIQTLELENKLLKNLIIEKGTEKSDNELKMLRERVFREEK